jgi:toxin ParE1/3/4
MYASAVVAKIFQVVDSLRELPESGSVVEEYANPEIRERLSGKYRIIYHLRDNIVDVLAVIHGARRLPKLLR